MPASTHSGPASRVQSDVDLFSQAHVADPYATLDELRELGPAVYMMRQDYWLLTRYEDVRRGSSDWQSFTSSEGLSLFELHNDFIRGTVLGTDPPEHDRLRGILSDKLAPRAMRHLRKEIAAKAEALVEALVTRGEFDAMADLACVFGVNTVADLVGLPEAGRERLHPGADAIFTGFGPSTPELEQRLPVLQAYIEYMTETVTTQPLAEGSWGAEVMAAVADGRLELADGLSTLSAYLTAGMDTTVNAIGAMLQRFAEAPEVWEILRSDPSRIGPVFEECLRYETPVQAFFRLTTRDVDVDGTVIPAGQRVMIHWGAGNRDPRHYSDPDRFVVDRNPIDHLAFGYGIHGCVGQGLARIEAAVLVDALASRVARFELTGPVVRHYNPVIRGLDSVPLRLA